MSRNKEEFDNWIKSMIEDLNSRSNHWYEVSSLEEWHWKKLWEIFDKYIDNNHFGAGVIKSDGIRRSRSESEANNCPNLH